jgi:hypothetical protein
VLKLQHEARAKRENGANYMWATYRCSGGIHAFNLNIAEVLALDPNKMKDGEIRCIGDCNYKDSSGVDIVRLAIKKTAKGFELGEAYFAESQCLETKFHPIDVTEFKVLKTEVKRSSQPLA